MNKTNKISIIIPAYNAELYLNECIMSVCKQSYNNLEIIIVDDGSTDNTLDIIEKIKKKDSRIIVVQKKNGGVSSARNEGMKKATGDYVLFLDADDWLDPDCCEVLMKEALSSDAEIIFFDYYKEYINKTVRCHAYKSAKLQNIRGKVNEFFIFNMKTVTPWGKLFKRSCLDNETYNEKMSVAEDVDFSFRVYKKITSAIYIHKCLMHYRVLEKSAIHGYDSNIKEKFEYSLKIINHTMGKNVTGYREAYYSFAAIAYLVICQNYYCLNQSSSFYKKMRGIKSFNNSSWVKDLFNNYKKIYIPRSRKLLVLFGKHNFCFGIWAIIELKKVMKR